MTARTKEAAKRYNMQYQAKHAPKLFEDRLLKKYGISVHEWAIMFNKQNGACAVCKEPFPKKVQPHVDHCHKTLKVRGLLCGDCNRGVGLFKDSPERLAAAAAYLENTV